MQEVLALVAPIISCSAAIPYVYDVVRGRTKPNIISWLTWAALTGAALTASLALHEYRTAWLLAGSTFCSLLIAGLGIRYGVARLGRFDAVCVGLIGLTFVLWAVSGSALAAIIAAVAIDCLGLLPTLHHAWVSPAEETWQAFAISMVAALATLFALQTLTFAAALYPVYLVGANGLAVVIILSRRVSMDKSPRSDAY